MITSFAKISIEFPEKSHVFPPAPSTIRIPAAISGLETFTLADAPENEEEERQHGDLLDADSFFNLPGGDSE